VACHAEALRNEKKKKKRKIIFKKRKFIKEVI
jgi:hypothetical protein